VYNRPVSPNDKQEPIMTNTRILGISLCIAMLGPALAAASSSQQSSATSASTWSVSIDPSGLQSGAARRVGYPSENSAASLRHVGKDRRVLEAQSQLARVTTSSEGILIVMEMGRYSRSMATDPTGQRMSAPQTFSKLWLKLDRNGDVLSMELLD
jgi:hypothetical protein